MRPIVDRGAAPVVYMRHSWVYGVLCTLIRIAQQPATVPTIPCLRLSKVANAALWLDSILKVVCVLGVAARSAGLRVQGCKWDVNAPRLRVPAK